MLISEDCLIHVYLLMHQLQPCGATQLFGGFTRLQLAYQQVNMYPMITSLS